MKKAVKIDKSNVGSASADNGRGKTTGERIRKLRKDKEFTLGDLSEAVGFTPSYLSRVENDKAKLSIEGVRRIAFLLGTTTDFLLCDADHETAEEEVAALIEDDAKKSLALVNESRPFWRFLGVSVRYEASEEPFYKKTGEAIPVNKWNEINDTMLPPVWTEQESEISRRIAERYLSVHAAGKWYDIPPERWSSVVEIAKSAALGALKAACAVFDRAAKNMQ